MMDALKYYLRENVLIRTLYLPFKRAKLKVELRRYQRSKWHERIRKYHNIHNGETCFIVGNGPSLTVDDLDGIKQYPTFASNGIFNVLEQTEWKPTYYISVDPQYVDSHKKEIISLEGPIKYITCRVDFPESNDTERIFEYNKFKINKWNDQSAFINEDVSTFFSIGYTVTFTAIQMAIYMGFKTIVLLGVDFSYPVMKDKNGKVVLNDNIRRVHFYNDSQKEARYNIFNYEGALNAYKAAELYATKNGINILNATRGGNLEVFERVRLENYFSI